MSHSSFKETFLFSALSLNEEAELLKQSSKIFYRKGEVIYKQNAFVSEASLLLDGYARIYIETSNKKRTLKIIKPNWFIGLLSVFSHEVHIFSAIAIDDCSVLHIKKEFLKKLIQTNGEFALRFTRVLSLLATDLSRYLALQNQKNVRGRIADILIYLSETIFNSTQFTFQFTRKEVGEMANTTTETAIRIMNEFIAERVIELKGKQITIHKPDYLKNISAIS